MDSSTFSSSDKETQVLEFAITGMYGDLLAKQYGDELVKDVTEARDVIRDLVCKSVESREQAVYLSKKWFGDNAITVIQTFQQRLAEANKVPKKSKRSSAAVKQVKSEKPINVLDSKVIKLEAGDSNVVEMVQDESVTKKSKVKSTDKLDKSFDKVDKSDKFSDKDKSTVSDPSSPPKDESVMEDVVKPDSKKSKSSTSLKKRKLGADSEVEA